jgi:hypothetical protein
VKFNSRLGSCDELLMLVRVSVSLDLVNAQIVGHILDHPFGQGESFQRLRSPDASCVGLQGKASSPMLQEVGFCRMSSTQKRPKRVYMTNMPF